MNTLNQQNQRSNGHCTQTFFAEGRLVSNACKCGQRPFSAPELWRMQTQVSTDLHFVLN